MSSSLVSCVLQSVPESGDDGNSEDASRSPKLICESVKPLPERKILLTYSRKKKKDVSASKTTMLQHRRSSNKVNKKNESQNPRGKQPNRKHDDHVGPEHGCLMSWVCKNAACRAPLSKDDSFCKRCSCCVCHKFDDNKDPSLWLVCEPEESGEADFCGSSCHLDCAFQERKVGVIGLGKLMRLDGNYCCLSCGKVSGILRCWKKQLIAAKDARRVDVLCYRIYLSYRLLDGTSRFSELHEIVKAAKSKLEDEIGPLDGTSAKMARGIVSRLPVASEVQELCSSAIKKADEWLANASSMNLVSKDSLPAACRFQFEEVTHSSVIVHLIELPSPTVDVIKGYKLWYFQSKGEEPGEEPVREFLRTQRRMLISDLQPCTEYTFRVISFTQAGDLGHSEAKCFTQSIEILQHNRGNAADHKKEDSTTAGDQPSAPKEQWSISSRFKVRELGKFLRLAEAQEEGLFEMFYSADTEKDYGAAELPSRSRGFDLNMVSVPDLNEEFTPLRDSSGGEDNGLPLELPAEADDDDAASNGTERNNALVRSDGSGDSRGTDEEDVPAVDFLARLSRKRKANTNGEPEPHECDSALVKGSPNNLDENFEKCVKLIRWLERRGHINQEFRLKFLTWFSLRSSVQERRVVSTFIQTMEDDPGSLAGQLLDSFSDIVSSKRSRNGFFTRLWR